MEKLTSEFIVNKLQEVKIAKQTAILLDVSWMGKIWLWLIRLMQLFTALTWLWKYHNTHIKGEVEQWGLL